MMKKTIFVVLAMLLVLQNTAFAQDAALPEGAILLFGEDLANPGVLVNRFLKKDGEKADWKVEDGCLISTKKSGEKDNSNHIYSEVFFRDAHIHAEFMISEKGSGNSGLYIHGNYEMQVHHLAQDKKDVTDHDCGALYGFYAPKVNAALARDAWQTYDIDYTAPRRDENGKITEPGRITAYLNGKLVQDDIRFEEPKSNYHPYRYGETENLKKIWAEQKKTSVGPLFLQDHGNPVKFRNVWIKKTEN